YPYINPTTENVTGIELPFGAGGSLKVTPISTTTDGTQIWKLTHNGVDTHPLHFHLANVQLINRVTWDNIIIKPDPTELGWKDTVRVSPLEDTIVAIRPIVPKSPFGLPDSIRLLNPAMPAASMMGFNQVDPLGNAPATPYSNIMTNFGWEYVWHCHILGHEEMDMMRPITLNVSRAKPAAPVLTATGFSGNPVNLAWTDGTPADYSNPASWGDPSAEYAYRIERATGAGAFAEIGKALANATRSVNSGTVANLTYNYRVVAINAAGETVSNVVTVIPDYPLAPSVLTATAFSTTQINLAWTDNATNETSFTIQRATNANFTGATNIPLIPSNATSYSDTGLTANTTYYYRVSALNAVGSSAWSNTANATTQSANPLAPSVLTATAINSTQINLAWTDNASNETGFTIQRATNVNFTGSTTITVNLANSRSYNNTGLAANTTYYYRVRAFNAAGTSAWSNTANARTPNSIPAAPSNAVAAVARAGGNDQVTLTWVDNATNETGFAVQRATNAGFTTGVSNIGGIGANAITFQQTVTRRVTYYYRIQAVNAVGVSAWVVFTPSPIVTP
ncbi:MAG: fibronectin type III domain-containing protein, partial [Chloroflexota bacterium]